MFEQSPGICAKDRARNAVLERTMTAPVIVLLLVVLSGALLMLVNQARAPR
jgi:hypothetical protein